MFRSIHKYLLVSLASVFIAGCGSNDGFTPTLVSERTLFPSDVISAPAEDPIMTISGNLATGYSESFQVDRPILESVGTVEYSVLDPYEKEEVLYEGVLLIDLFDQFANDSSESVTITALDDYVKTIDRSLAEKYYVLLALKSNGVYVEPDYRGPSLIVFPYDDFPELDPTIYDPMWVWQIDSLVFN